MDEVKNGSKPVSFPHDPNCAWCAGGIAPHLAQLRPLGDACLPLCDYSLPSSDLSTSRGSSSSAVSFRVRAYPVERTTLSTVAADTCPSALR